jgi:hypothetical protein
MAARDPKAEAEAAASFIQPDRTLEAPKDAAPGIHGNARTMVSNPNADVIPAVLGTDLDGSVSPIFDGVGDEIVDDLLHGQPIPSAEKALRGMNVDLSIRVAGHFSECRNDLPH